MFYSHFTPEKILSSDQILISVLKKNKHYCLIAEGILNNESFVKVLTHYKNYFLNICGKKLNHYKTLNREKSFFISTHQFAAVANQNLQLNKNLSHSLKCFLNESRKNSIVDQLSRPFPLCKPDEGKRRAFEQKKKFYLRLSAIDAFREGLDWSTMPLLLFWIPISFVNLTMTSLILLIVLTTILTAVVASYTTHIDYKADKNELKKLIKYLVHDPLDLPQKHDLTYSRDFALPALNTATTLFSFFWVIYDMSVALGKISSLSLSTLPLVVMAMCGIFSVIFASLHFYKLMLENQLYESICGEK